MKKVLSLLVFTSLGMTALAQSESIGDGKVGQQDSLQSAQLVQVLNGMDSETLTTGQPNQTARQSASMSAASAYSQNQQRTSSYYQSSSFLDNCFRHLDLSLSVGTMGVGIDVATNIGDYVQLRAGYDYMPRFTVDMEFDLIVGGKPARQYDSNGNRVESTFDRLKEMLYQYTGYEVDDHIDMIGKPTMNNFRFLVDVYPFEKKNWHFTGGFYWGPSKFAEAENSTEAMVSLLSVGLYNQIYDKCYAAQQAGVLPVLISIPDPNHPGDPDYNTEIKATPSMRDMIANYGRMGFGIGEYAHDVYDTQGNKIHSEGERYVMAPDDKSMVRVQAKSNSFKPYIGFGYTGNLSKYNDEWKISFDCGALFWNGFQCSSPDLYVHDGTNLVTDIKNIDGQVGTYVDLFKAFKVYPTLSIRLIKRLF